MQMLFPSARAREYVVDHYGVNQTLRRLAEYLPQMAARKDPGSREFIVTRVFDAPRELVFKAFTEPESSRHWLATAEFTNPVCELDLPRAGAVRILLRGPDGPIYPMMGAFNEGAAPERLVFTSIMLDEMGKALFELLHAIKFDEHGGKTRLTLHVSVATGTVAAPCLAGMEQGWNQSLDRLARNISL